MRSLVRSIRRSKRSPWRARAVWFAVAVGALLFITLAVRNMLRRDALWEWRRGLESMSANASWPSWRSEWPPLPAPPRRNLRLGDLRGPYAYAAQSREALRYIPCYCGCVGIGHRSNVDCYITEFLPDGTPHWTDHAFT
jgi:hypothetical protein